MARARWVDGQPFCCQGCALVSRIVGRHTPHRQRAWNLLRLGIGALFAMNTMMISLLLYTGRVEPDAVGAFRWALLALSTPAMGLLGYPMLMGAAGELMRRRPSLDTLVAVGSFAAFGVSAVSVIRGAGKVYFDTATMLPVLVTFGRLLEATAKSQARELIHGLERLLPRTARRVSPEGDQEVQLGALCVGDTVRIRPGERIPVDGRVVEGQTEIHEAEFTGEPLPRNCGVGDTVLAGAVNGPGGLLVAAERVGGDTVLRRLVDLVATARLAATPAERLAERAATLFIPIVVLLAVVSGIFWAATAGVAKGGFVALSVLVVACPCAMAIAAPLATALGLGRAARAGVLVRGGDVLERVGRIDLAAFDKTGTVTEGRPVVRRVESLDATTPETEVLAWLAGVESGSEHAMAKAIVAEAQARGLDIGTVSDVCAVPGQGVRGMVQRARVTRVVSAGNAAFVAHGALTPADPAPVDGLVAYVAWDGAVRGRVGLDDRVRPDAPAAIAQLRQAGVETVLLSGDRLENAQAMGAAVGIRRIEAPCLPHEKVVWVQGAAQRGATVAMVGDGINDAPALAAAAVGIALGTATDLTKRAGHIIVLGDRLTRIPWVVALGRETRRVIRQNLAWALAYNGVALVAAAAGWLHPLVAAVAMVVSSLTVLANSVRLQRFPESAAGP